MNENQFLFNIPEADNINHVVIFMTGQMPFPEGLGGAGRYFLGWGDPFHHLILICTINVLPIQFHSCVQLQVDWFCLCFVVVVVECLHKLYCLFFVVVVFECLHFTNCTCLLFSTL